jgi:hypothetical protein
MQLELLRVPYRHVLLYLSSFLHLVLRRLALHLFLHLSRNLLDSNRFREGFLLLIRYRVLERYVIQEFLSIPFCRQFSRALSKRRRISFPVDRGTEE